MSFGSSIAGLFGRSPIKPLQQHYDTVHQCACTLADFFTAVTQSDWDQARTLRKRIAELENEADELKKEFRLNLPKSLFLPVPRTDLLELISVQDKVANKAKDISGLMLGREMSIPATLADAMLSYVQGAIDTSAQAQKAINELDELVETGFSGREIKLVEDRAADHHPCHPVQAGKRTAPGGCHLPLQDHRMGRRSRRSRPESGRPPADVGRTLGEFLWSGCSSIPT